MGLIDFNQHSLVSLTSIGLKLGPITNPTSVVNAQLSLNVTQVDSQGVEQIFATGQIELIMFKQSKVCANEC